MEEVLKYFPKITEYQKQIFLQLKDLYIDWNSKINLISRKDMDFFEEHHLLHSLSIAKFINFSAGTKVIDVGTGGGFPGIPLSVMFPETEFMLIDSIGKKIKAVQSIIETLNLPNVKTQTIRSESFMGEFDFIVSRAVAAIPEFVKQTRHLISKKHQNAISNGIIYLKGGDLSHEIISFKRMTSIIELKTYFEESYFSEKKLIHISI